LPIAEYYNKITAVGTKVGAKQKYFLSNKAIVYMKLVTACMAFFAYCLFFGDNRDYFIEDFKSVRILFPLIFIIGVAFIVWYIFHLVDQMESELLWQADRFYILYQIIFTVVMLSIICRSFFAELYTDKRVVIVLILSGIATLCTPPIRDNDNDEF
jgi:hypothetical protein